MDLCQLHRDVSHYIRQVDFATLWPGFVPLRFALYNDELCCFDGGYIEKTPEFLANTSIEYCGEQIAIWYVQETLDPIGLAAKLIHEMFHGHQKLSGGDCFPDDLHALYAYRYVDENLTAKLQENRILADMVDRFSPQKLQEFLSLRKYRAENFPTEFSYEVMTEQIEGTATFVELEVLRQLDPVRYRAQLEQMCKTVMEPASLLPIRIVSYDVGALFLHVLRENDIPFATDFRKETFAEGLLTSVTPASCAGKEMAQHMEAYYSEARLAIQRKGEVIFEGNAPLVAVNVYNAVYFEGHILSKFFVMYGENPTVEYGDFLIETPSERVVTKIYRMP